MPEWRQEKDYSIPRSETNQLLYEKSKHQSHANQKANVKVVNLTQKSHKSIKQDQSREQRGCGKIKEKIKSNTINLIKQNTTKIR